MPSAKTLIILLAVWMGASSLWRLYRGRKRSIGPVDFPARVKSATPTLLNYAASLFIVAGLYAGAGLFLRDKDLGYVAVLAAAIFLSATVDVVGALVYPTAMTVRPSRLVLPAASVLIGIAVFFCAQYLRSKPSDFGEIQLVSPVRGQWRVSAGGRSAWTNYHHDHPVAQNFAVDLVNDRGESEGEPIDAPVDGMVVQVFGDRLPGGAEAEGNLVVIQDKDGVEVWLAHLKENSLAVRVNDRVVAGQQVGECGSTGSAVEPHLHIHAQKGGRPVPIVFGNDKRFLVTNDCLIGTK